MAKAEKAVKVSENVEFLMLPSTLVTYVRSNPRMILSSSVAIEPYNPTPKVNQVLMAYIFSRRVP